MFRSKFNYMSLLVGLAVLLCSSQTLAKGKIIYDAEYQGVSIM